MQTTETKPIRNADKPMRAALRAMAGQLEDSSLRSAIWRLLDGEKPTSADDDSKPKVLSAKEAARMLGVTVRTVGGLAKSGAVRRVKLPGRVRACGYLRASVESLLAAEG